MSVYIIIESSTDGVEFFISILDNKYYTDSMEAELAIIDLEAKLTGHENDSCYYVQSLTLAKDLV